MDPSTLQVPALPTSDVATLILSLASIVYCALWWRDRESGMGWLGLAMAILAVWFAASSLHRPTGPYIVRTSLAYIPLVAAWLLAFGLINYFSVPQEKKTRWLWLIVTPSVFYGFLLTVTITTGIPIPRYWGAICGGLSFGAMGVLALTAARDEPQAGHLYVGLSFLSVPVLAITFLLARFEPYVIRYWALVPLFVLAMTLPTVSMLRRRLALEMEVSRRCAAEEALKAMNQSLEEVVDQRTDDLQSFVTGLQSFSHSASHDLRSSIGGMAGIAREADEALSNGDIELARRAMQLISVQADTSSQLVAALLELARAGNVRVKREQLQLGPLVEDVIREVRRRASPDVPLEFRFNALPEVNADPALLRRILSILVDNSIKFRAKDTPALIEVSAVLVGEEAIVSVRDNGVGFDSEYAPHLFDPFVRLHGTAFDGHGIGLSIARRAIERHGGRIWAQSSPRQGATIHFSLPLGQ